MGSRQGCVAGSLAFCLALQPILQTIAHEYPDLLILSYCDDMYIIGTPERAAHAYRRYAFLISQHLQAQLRDDKAHAYSPAAPKRGNPTMTTTTVTARRKGDPQHYVEVIKYESCEPSNMRGTITKIFFRRVEASPQY